MYNIIIITIFLFLHNPSPLTAHACLWTSACAKHSFSPEEPYSKRTEEGGNNMLTVCAYLGTIRGEKLNEPEPDLSPICKNKKTSRTRPEWTQRVGPRLVPTGLQGSSPQLYLRLLRLGTTFRCCIIPLRRLYPWYDSKVPWLLRRNESIVPSITV